MQSCPATFAYRALKVGPDGDRVRVVRAKDALSSGQSGFEQVDCLGRSAR